MLVCGIGCRRGTSAEEIAVAINAAQMQLRCVGEISVIATEASKLEEPGLRDAARRLDIALVGYSAEELSRVSDAVLTVSAAALSHKGTPSVAEAAALLAGGTNARLLGPRLATATTTCAFAVGDGGSS